jgi:pSer/pThr/pTyr-binding forkhead associated (FHA) protein
MPVIQVKDTQHILKPGQTRLGAGPGVDVIVSDEAALGVQAILELAEDAQVVIRRGRDGANVRVNGVVLGVEPTPLMHGDKLDVNGIEVLFSEDKKIGATHFVSANEVAAIAAKRSGPARATASTGGRLVSLVDGKEYQIPAAGVVFGREAGSDVVVAQPEVSRRHASIAPTEQGYVLQDLSTNGVWVNGTRVQGSAVLARADVVRVGTEEFRFYADVAQPPPKASAPTPVAAPRVVTPSVEPPTVAPVASAPRPAAPPAAVAGPSGGGAPPAPAAPSAASPVADATARVPHMPPAVAPSSGAPESRKEPTTGGGSVRPEKPAASARPVQKPQKTAPAAIKPEKTGVPAWVWILIIVIVGVAAYFFGQRNG